MPSLCSVIGNRPGEGLEPTYCKTAWGARLFSIAAVCSASSWLKPSCGVCAITTVSLGPEIHFAREWNAAFGGERLDLKVGAKFARHFGRENVGGGAFQQSNRSGELLLR